MLETKKLMDMGFLFHQDGKLEQAETAYLQALNKNKDNAEVFNLLGVLKLQQNDVISAINYIEKAIKISPNEYYYETLFQAYIRAKIYRQIIQNADEILEKYPRNFSLMFNIALAYKNMNNIESSIKFYEKAIDIDPTSYQAWFNISNSYSIIGDVKNAVLALKTCEKLKPNDTNTQYFLSLALMRTKDYKKGLKLFENRISRETALLSQEKTYPNKGNRSKLWNGENIKNKTLMVYYEAGFGDVIMFARYLPLVAQKCKKLIFKCQKQLMPLFKNNNLGVDEFIEGFVPENNIDFDVHAPLLSLPYLLGLKGDKVFAYSNGYIEPDKNLAEQFKNKYFDNTKIKVGIKWQGNTYFDQKRVIPARAFKPLIEVENTQYYSFQTFEGAEDIKELDNIIDIGKDLTDFGQTAAALSNLDLVICNDTSLAHLAGAMRIPCWVILPCEADWRWHSDLKECDWYESIKLFRQHQINDWSGVFNDILKEMLPVEE